MKAIYRIIIAAATASLALVSCSKELNSPDKAQTDGLGEERVITLTFDEATKSQISGYHPSFKAGDLILLSNGSSKEERTVSIDSYGNATVTTTLTGTLKAVYPASAAATSGNSITGISVPSTQHGTFAEANIAMAENIIPGGMARFKLKTAVLRFYVDVTIGVQSITVTSEGADIATGGKTISVTPLSPATTLYEMTTDHPDRRVCYVAVLPGVAAGDLTFESDTDSQDIVTRRSPGTGTLAVKGMYDAFIPYYIKIHIGPGANDSQKWAYCNIGAFLPEEAGKYFAWGDIQGQTWNGSSWSNEGFSTAPDVGSPVPTELPLQFDAAYQNWGSPWQMPSTSDYTTLISETGTTKSDFINTTAKKGLQIHGTALFFPAAGYGNGGSLKNNDGNGTQGDYWSSTIGITTGESYPSQLYFFFGATTTPDQAIYSPFCNTNCFRRLGESIRPIYKTPAGPLDIGEYDEPENIE